MSCVRPLVQMDPYLLEAVRTAAESQTFFLEAEQLPELPGVEFLRRMWVQQYWTEIKEDGQSHLRGRGDDNQPPGALRLHSPYDEEVRYSVKREKGWVGIKLSSARPVKSMRCI